MTLRNDARMAGIAYLSYIVFTMSSAILYGRALAGHGTAAQLSHLGESLAQAHLSVLLDLLQVLCALVLAVTLFRLTRAVDETLALLAMMFRVGEGLLGTASIASKLELMWVINLPHGDALALGNYLLHRADSRFAEFSFLVGGLLFAHLLQRGRLIPALIAWLGVVTIGVQLLAVTLNISGFIAGSEVEPLWFAIMFYEIPLGIWLIAKGVRAPEPRQVQAKSL